MEVNDDLRLLRYLHYGSEDGIYTPGCRFFLRSFTPEAVSSFYQMLKDQREKDIISIIKKVYTEKSSAHPEALIFILAQCAANKTSKSLRESAMLLAESYFTAPDDFLLFLKFAFEVPPKLGTGRACRRLIKNWYLKKPALELAEIVAAKRRYRGWSHASLISLAHVSSKDKAKAAVLKFVIEGFESAQKSFGNEPETEEVLSYLENVSSFRKLTDPHAAARKIECYMLGLDHVGSRLFKNKEVWNSLLRAMPLEVLLNHMKFLTKRGMLRYGATWDYDFIKSIGDALGNPSKISDSQVHPSRVYIEMCTYIYAARLKLELAVKLHNQPPKQPPALSPELLKGFERLLKGSYKNIESSDLTYVIGIDINEAMQGRRCSYSRYVATGKAASLIALVTMKAAKNTTVLAFGQNSVEPISLTTEATIDEVWTTVQQVPSGPVDVKRLFGWAIKERKKVDVFIILTTLLKVNQCVEELNKYCNELDAPNARLVVCNLCGTPRQQPIVNMSNVLTISGFDSKVCKVIQSFSKNLF